MGAHGPSELGVIEHTDGNHLHVSILQIPLKGLALGDNAGLLIMRPFEAAMLAIHHSILDVVLLVVDDDWLLG